MVEINYVYLKSFIVKLSMKPATPEQQGHPLIKWKVFPLQEEPLLNTWLQSLDALEPAVLSLTQLKQLY